MMIKLLEVSHRQFNKIVRIMTYVGLSLMLFVCTLTESLVGFGSLLLIPATILILISTNYILHKVEYHYGKEVSRNVLYLIDVFISALFIAAMYATIIPTMVVIGALIYEAITERINRLTLFVAPILAVAIFFFAGILFFNLSPALMLLVGSIELNAITIFNFVIFVCVNMSWQVTYSKQLVAEKKHYVDEMNRYLHLSNQLARYAPQQVWQSIMKGGLEAKVLYQRRKLTVFFSDIKGFTDLSEKLSPDDLAYVLNDYLVNMTEIAKEYGGTVDKFMGDGLLIFFGDPETKGVKQDAIACINMAIAMRQRMRILSERWEKMGFQALHIRMGISTAYCHVGNYGTPHRMSYTILGRDVNLAQRLQSAADIDQIYISEETYQHVKHNFIFEEVEPLTLKGIIGEVHCWKVIDHLPARSEYIQNNYDIEYRGFNLLLDMEKAAIYEYPNIIEALQKTIKRLETQQKGGGKKVDLRHAPSSDVYIDEETKRKRMAQQKENSIYR